MSCMRPERQPRPTVNLCPNNAQDPGKEVQASDPA